MDGNPSDDFYFNNTTPAVVTDIIKSLPASKAIGHDDIPTRLVKDSISILARSLSTLFNSSIASNCFPACWKSGQVTPVFKKDTEYLKENYRPITVLVTFSNIMERILSQQLVNFFDEKLSPYLSAYCRNYSCQTALLRILEELRIACDHKSIAAIVGIDITKAFDCLPHELPRHEKSPLPRIKCMVKGFVKATFATHIKGGKGRVHSPLNACERRVTKATF